MKYADLSVMRYKHNSAHFPINPAINTHIEDYTLFSTSSPHHYIKTNHWKIHNYPLGDGTFGVVNLATHLTGGIQAAIKTIDSRGSGPETWRERVDKEVGSMKKLNHPNVMKVLDKIKNTGQRFDGDMGKVVEDENDRVWDWESEGIWKAHIVFELATGGDLFSYMEAGGALPESEARFIAYQLVLGVDHLHTHDVAHRGKLTIVYRG
jgi:serine/threonine protein kinase